MAKWKTPEWASPESKFLDLIAESADDFYQFAHETFSVKGNEKGEKPYTVRRRTINGKTWILVNDPCLDGGNVLGLKVNEEAETVLQKLIDEKRIKVLDG